MKILSNDDASGGKDPVAIVLALLQELSVPVTDATVRDSVYSHPYYPSLLCIADNLERWGVDTLALDVSVAGLAELPCPFLAHCPAVGADPFRIVTSAGETELVCMDSHRRIVSMPVGEFCGIWDGKVLLMEKRDQPGERDFAGKRRSERWAAGRLWLAILVILLPVMGGIWRYLAQPGNSVQGKLFYLTLTGGGILGVLTTMLLVMYAYGWGDSRLQRLCSLGGNISCEAVLRSPAALLWRKLSWSELGLVYFSGALLYSCLAGYGLVPLAALATTSYLSLGFVVFSVFYQGLIIRKWCFLCLLVQALLLGESVVALLTAQEWGMAGGWLLAVSFLFAGACWMLIKPLLSASKDATRLQQQLNRLKRKEIVFRPLLGQSETLFAGAGAVGLPLSEAGAEHSVVVISNPFCAPCANIHRKLEQLLDSDTRWAAQVIFSIVDEDEYAAGVVGAFIAAADRGGAKVLREHMHDWYENGDRNKALRKGKKGEDVRQRLAAMSDWCQRAGIRYTPVVYVDGRLLPEPYDLTDLQYIF